MTAHLCHAIGCIKPIPPRMFMCPRHWRMVPKGLQSAIWAAYVEGQEIRKDPTPEYCQVANVALLKVVRLEYGIKANTVPDALRIIKECPGHGRKGRGLPCCSQAGDYRAYLAAPCPKNCCCHIP